MRHLLERPMMDMPQTSSGSAANEDTVAVPVYEIDLNTADTGDLSSSKKATATPGAPLHIRCSATGPVSDQPDLTLLHNGNFIQESKDATLEESDKMKIYLKVSNFNEKWSGTYECSVRNSKGSVSRSRLTVQPKADAYNATMFGEVPCDPEISTQCLNGGTCYQNPAINTFSCKCTLGFSGPTCAYHSPDVITANSIVGKCPETPNSCIKLFIYGSVVGVVFCAVLIAIFLYLRNRMETNEKHQRRSFDSNCSCNSTGKKKSYLSRDPLDNQSRRDYFAQANHEREVLFSLSNTPAVCVTQLSSLVANEDSSYPKPYPHRVPVSQRIPIPIRQRKLAFCAFDSLEGGCYQNPAQVISRDSSSNNLDSYSTPLSVQILQPNTTIVTRLSEASCEESCASRSPPVFTVGDDGAMKFSNASDSSACSRSRDEDCFQSSFESATATSEDLAPKRRRLPTVSLVEKLANDYEADEAMSR